MFEKIIREHYLSLLTRHCACGGFVLDSSLRGYDTYVEHLNAALVASMPEPVLEYWNYMEGK